MRRLVLLAVAGCAEPSTPFFARSGVVVENDSVYFGVTRMDFGTSTVPLPTALLAEATSLLRPLDTCAPSLSGVALQPAVAAVGDTTLGARSELQVLELGPVRASVRASYEVPYQCGPDNKLTGTATFTFFPNGRVMRTDENIVASMLELTSADPCPCFKMQGDQFQLKSFWAFERGTVLDDQGTPATGALVGKPSCVVIDGYTIGIKQDGGRSITSTTAGYPVAEIELSSSMASWPVNQPPASSKSQMIVFPGNDAATCLLALDTLADPTLFINNTAAPVVDGIYQAISEPHRGRTTFDVPVRRQTGFAVLIDLGGATHARVLYNDSVSDNYIVQSLGEHVLFYFPGLEVGDTLTIEPL